MIDLIIIIMAGIVLLFLLSCCFMVARLLDEEISMYGYEGKKYLGVQMNKKDKPSIMKKLMHFKDAVSKGKNRERAREQQKDRGQSL